MEKLFGDFDPVSYADWLQKIETDLKGKPLSVLHTNPEPDLEITAYHHAENSEQHPLIQLQDQRSNNEWNIRENFEGESDEALNQRILTALNDGVNAIGLTITPNTDFAVLSKAILFEHIQTDCRFNDMATATNFDAPAGTILNFDIIALNAKKGKMVFSPADYLTFYQQHKDNATLWVDGYIYGESGASTVQELAFTLSHLNEYVHSLVEAGVPLAEVNDKLTLCLSVNTNYFVNVCKFRVVRTLVRLLFEAYEADHTLKAPRLFAQTNIRHLAKNDANNNPLRETTQAMSAIVGGCDTLTVAYPSDQSDKVNARFGRIAKNIQLILKEEAYLNQVIDPSAGAYYMESLTGQLLEKAWNLFLTIENKGGLLASLESNTIQELIAANKAQLIDQLNSGERTFLGVNKYPNAMEDWKTITTPEAGKEEAFQPLTAFQLEDYYTTTTAES